MYTQADKNQEDQNRSVANALSQKQPDSRAVLRFGDHQIVLAQRKKLQTLADNSVQSQRLFQLQKMANQSIVEDTPPIQRKENRTGLPDHLKSGIEKLSGYAMDDVKVHYNSDKPAQLNAHAYAQGTDIHLGAGQEKHLPHEAWHVVQQKQGRVKPTFQMKERVEINDDERLEKEADVMGAKAMQFKTAQPH